MLNKMLHWLHMPGRFLQIGVLHRLLRVQQQLVQIVIICTCTSMVRIQRLVSC